MKDDYLKYYRIVRYFMQAKHNLSQAEIETLIFLRSEKYFTMKNFEVFNEIFVWDKERFNKLRDNGWIVEFPKRKLSRQMYELSFKAKRMVTEIYKILDGQPISEVQKNNPLFAARVPYTHKVYRNAIKEMNEFRRQQRHLSQKSQ